MPSKTLILHIGDHKTGSTSIQYAFAGKRVKLAGQRVQYPGTLSHNSLRGQLVLLRQPEDTRKQATDKLSRMAERFANSNADILLLSAESLDGADPQQVKDMVDRFFGPIIDQLRIAAYVRPHAPRILSSFATQTKSGRFAGTLQEFHHSMLDKGRLMYLPRFLQWRETFGDAFHLRPMVRKQLVNSSVLDDFITHMMGCDDYQITTLPPANPSLPLRDLMRLKMMHQSLGRLARADRHSLGWEFQRLATTQTDPTPQPKLALHHALAEDIRTAYAADAEAMDQTFFGGAAILRPDLDQAVEKAIPEALSVDPADYFSPEEIRSLTALSNLTATLVRHKPAKWRAHLKQKRVAALAL